MLHVGGDFQSTAVLIQHDPLPLNIVVFVI